MIRSLFRFVVPILGVVLLAISLSAWVDYVDSVHIIEAAQKRVQMVLCKEISNELQLRLNNAVEKARAIAALPAVIKALQVPTDSPEFKKIRAQLQELVVELHAQHSMGANVLLLSIDGTVLANARGVTQEVVRKIELTKILTGQLSIGSGDFVGTGVPVPFVAAPVYDGAKPLGAVIGIIAPVKLSSLWISRLADTNERLMVYNAENELLFRSYESNRNEYDKQLSTQQSLFKEASENAINIETEAQHLTTSVIMSQTGWKVMVSSPRSTVFTPVQNKLVHTLMINGVMMLMLTGIVGYLLLRKNKLIISRENALLEVNNQLQSLTNNIPGGVFKLRMDEKYSIIYANDEFYKLHGYTKQQMQDEINNSPLAYVRKDYIQPTIDLIYMALGNNDAFEFKIPITKRDKTEAWLLVRGTFTRDEGDVPIMDCIVLDITASMNLETELQKSKTRLQLVIDSSLIPIWRININSGLIYYNQYFLDMMGWKEYGETCTFDELMSRTHDDDKAFFEKALNDHLIGEADIYEAEYRLRHGDGHWHWVLARGRCVSATQSDAELEVMGTLVDMHSHKIAALAILEQANTLEKLVQVRTAELNNERVLLRTMMNTIPDLFFYKDAQGVFQACNKAFLECYNFASENEVLGKTNQELFPGQDGMCTIFDSGDGRALLGSAPISFEYELTLSNGLPMAFETIKSPMFTASGEHIGLVGISRDITSRKKMESALLESQQEAEDANKAKSEFLANMSHEIRTPLNGIIGMNYLAQQADPSPRIKDYLQKMATSARNLLSIINDILDFSKIEAGKVELEQNVFALNDLLMSVKDMFGPAAQKAGVELRLHLEDNVPPVLVGDSLRISQILLNLLSNALKFTKAGWISVSIQARERKHDSVLLEITVEDTGIGMTEVQCGKLFTAFTQADSSISRRYGGTGLGLSICKGLVELMGGHITVRSEFGKGSAFSFTLCLPLPESQPNAPTDRHFQEHLNSNSTRDDGALLHSLRVLLVEDNEINQLIAEEILQQFGCIVDTANDGIQAITKAHETPHDIILMDIQMPVMDGFEATRLLRSEARFDAVPIIAMTAHAMESDRDKSLTAGMQDHVTKPIDPNLLKQALLKWREGTGK